MPRQWYVIISRCKAKIRAYLSTHRPTRPAPDAAGAARNLVRFSCASRAVSCADREKLPAAQVRRTLGRPQPLKQLGRECEYNHPLCDHYALYFSKA